jgi:hypothetical protein
VNLTAGGDARFTVSSRLPLNDATDRAAFRAMVADLRNDSSTAPPVGYSPQTFRRFADRVAEVTGRPMTVTDAGWTGTVRNDTGVVSLSFTWTNFARTDGDRLLLGDVFAADVGWFDSLTDDQRLAIAAPPNYAVVESPFPIQEGVILIDGPEDVPEGLAAENVSVVYAPTATQPTPTSTTGDQRGEFPLVLVGGVVLVVVAVVAGAYLLYGRPDDGPAPGSGPGTGDAGAGAATEPTSTGDTDAGPTASASSETTAADPDAGDTAADGTATPGTGANPAATTGADTTASDTDTGAGEASSADTDTDTDESGGPAVDEELLSDEERVERLLSANGGRMKQANIVSETGWSSAKVSQLLSSMDEAGRVDKLRIGRENLISLPEESVVDTGPDSASASSEEES